LDAWLFFTVPHFRFTALVAGDYFPREIMATVIGVWTPFYVVGAILAHWMTGMLRDGTGVYQSLL